MKNKIIDILNNFGLDKKEVEVYLKLVEKKELNAYVLAKLVGLHRSSTYNILERLILKGFVSKVLKGNTTFYSALEIGQPLAKIKEKETLLLSLIPELERIQESNVSKVRVLESKESQKQFNFNLFNQIEKGSIKELYIIDGGPTEENLRGENSLEDFSSRLFLEGLLKELRKKNFNKRLKYLGIWAERFRKSKLLEFFSKLGENRFLKGLPTLTTTVIFGEYIAYLFTIDGAPQVIEIQNKLIAEENKAYFSYLWMQANP